MARSFNGSTQWLNRTAAGFAYPLTIAAWVRCSSFGGGNRTVAGIDHSTNHSIFAVLRLTTAGAVEAVSYDLSTIASAVTGVNASTNVWQHVCAVFNSSTDRRVYLNGGSKATTATSCSPTGPDRAVCGARSDGEFLTGDIGDVAILFTALTDADVAMLATGISPLAFLPKAGSGIYAPLIGVFSPEIDIISRNELTLVNAPAQASSHPPVLWLRPPGLTQRPTAVFHISGNTKDNTGAAVGSCTVKLYRTSDDALIASTTSDASTGAFSFTVGNTTTQYYLRAYKAGSPDVAGTSVNTVVGA